MGSEQFLDVKSCAFNSPGVGGLKRGFLMAVMVLHSPETFSAILTLEDPLQRGVGGIALLTLSDTEDALHFLLLFRGLLGGESWGRCTYVRVLGRFLTSQKCSHMWRLQD